MRQNDLKTKYSLAGAVIWWLIKIYLQQRYIKTSVQQKGLNNKFHDNKNSRKKHLNSYIDSFSFSFVDNHLHTASRKRKKEKKGWLRIFFWATFLYVQNAWTRAYNLIFHFLFSNFYSFSSAPVDWRSSIFLSSRYKYVLNKCMSPPVCH